VKSLLGKVIIPWLQNRVIQNKMHFTSSCLQRHAYTSWCHIRLQQLLCYLPYTGKILNNWHQSFDKRYSRDYIDVWRSYMDLNLDPWFQTWRDIYSSECFEACFEFIGYNIPISNNFTGRLFLLLHRFYASVKCELVSDFLL